MLALSASAQVPDHSRLAAAITKGMHQANMKGWRGIYFFCEYEEVDKVQAQVCDRAKTQARFLARSLRIRLNAVSGWGEFFEAKAEPDHLVLLLKLQATTGSAPSALAADLLAVASMGVDLMTPRSQTFWPGHSLSGYLVLWNQSVLGASSGGKEELITALSDAIDQNLKFILTDYTEINAVK
jgi:hypothetical protein